ncbi:MAG TPA: hypothetical protein VHA37_06990 [Candidatus Saccharimonadales bacterium]|nr:hypothetical protein [Candidatus Saccharimonadales bacterium]
MIEYFRGIRLMIEGDAKFMRRVNGWLAVFWIVMIPVSLYFGWLKSVTFVSALSLWALVSGHWSAWQAARVEVEQQKEERRDTDGRIVRRIIKESNLHRSKRPKAAHASHHHAAKHHAVHPSRSAR